MTQHVSARTGSGLAGAVVIYIAGLVAVTNAMFSAGVAATTHVPGGLARTGTYSVSLAAGAPGVSALAAGAGDIIALDAWVAGAASVRVAPTAGEREPANPLAPVSIAGVSPIDTPTYQAAVRVSGLTVASTRAAIPTNITLPATARPHR